MIIGLNEPWHRIDVHQFHSEAADPGNSRRNAIRVYRLRARGSSDLLDWTLRTFVEQFSAAGAIKILPVKDLTWIRPIGVVYRRETYLPPVVKRLIEIIKDQAKKIAVSS